MIGKEIITALKTITAVSTIFGNQIYFGNVMKMKTGPFLYVSELASSPYTIYSETGPTEHTQNFQFIIVGDMNTTETVLSSWADTIAEALGVGCNRKQSLGGKRVYRMYPTTRSPIIYNQERPTITQDFTFTT